MSRNSIRQVEVYHSFAPSRFLIAEGQPAVEVLAKGFTLACACFSAALQQGEPLAAETSWVRFVLASDSPGFAPATTPVPSASDGLGEVHEVSAPLHLLELSPADRRLATLDQLYEWLRTLASVRGWNLAVLEAARGHVVRSGLRFERTSIPKSSPDRRHKAVAHCWIDDSGDSWCRVNIIASNGEVALDSGPVDASDFPPALNRIIRSLRWRDRNSVLVTTWPGGLPPDGVAGLHRFQLPV